MTTSNNLLLQGTSNRMTSATAADNGTAYEQPQSIWDLYSS